MITACTSPGSGTPSERCIWNRKPGTFNNCAVAWSRTFTVTCDGPVVLEPIRFEVFAVPDNTVFTAALIENNGPDGSAAAPVDTISDAPEPEGPSPGSSGATELNRALASDAFTPSSDEDATGHTGACLVTDAGSVGTTGVIGLPWESGAKAASAVAPGTAAVRRVDAGVLPGTAKEADRANPVSPESQRRPVKTRTKTHPSKPRLMTKCHGIRGLVPRGGGWH